MKKIWKKLFSFLLVLCMSFSGMSLTAFAAEDDVCKIGENGYATLAEAITASEESDTIVMLKNIELGSKQTIKHDLTISGAHTISRGTYTGTLFEVKAGATLTLDGGLTLDGNNNWEFDSEGYYGDMADGLSFAPNSRPDLSYTTSKGTKAAAQMIIISASGEVVVNKATIQNCYADNHNDGGLFKIPAGATLIMNEGALINHIHSSVAGQIAGTWTMNGGKIDDVYGHSTNGGVVDLRGGTVNIKGGEITHVRTLGLNANGNGILAQVFGAKSKLNISGGYIHDNASYAPGGGWGAVLYTNGSSDTDGGQIEITGGIIENTLSFKTSAFAHKRPGNHNLLGGTMKIEPSVGAPFDSLFYGAITIGEDMNIVGIDDAYFYMLGDMEGHALVIDGEISGGTMWLGYDEPVTGEGTVTSDVIVQKGSYDPDGVVTIAGGNWRDNVITVNSVGSGAKLTVTEDAILEDGLVRVLESVESGNYLDEASADAQASSYKNEGATVTSPVLFYHRLTSAQKSNIVVTYDYNGGLDAQGWSGSQLTSAETFVPESPVPTKVNYEFAGWKYAVENDPESLSMEGTADYNGEEIAESVRLIAQWKFEAGSERTLEINKVTEIGEGNTKLTYQLEGIEFEIYYAGTVDEYTEYVKNYAAANPVADEKDIQDAFAAEKAAEVTEEELLETVKTGENGKALYVVEEDGIYLIIEKEHPAIVEPLDPFVVAVPMTTTTTAEDGTSITKVEYDVVINPKNEVVPGPEVNKNVTEIDLDIDSFAVGDEVTWILRGEVPADLANGKSYMMYDVVDECLDLVDDAVIVTVEAVEGENVVALTDSDYTFEYNKETREIEFALTKAGMKAAADAEAVAKAEMEIRVYFNTKINEKAVVGNKIPNHVKLEYTNSVNFYYEDADDAAAYTCGINIYKYDAKNKETALAGAKFKLAKAVSEDTEGAVNLVLTGKKVATVVYEDFYTAVDATTGAMTGLATEVETDENGAAMLYGLDEGQYYLVETEAPAGYNLLSYPLEIAVDQTSYTAVIEVANSNQFKLPSTGGIGTTIFTLAGAALTVVSGTVLVGKKRKEEEE